MEAHSLLQNLEFLEINKKPGVLPLIKLKEKSVGEQICKALNVTYSDLFEGVL